MSQTLMVRRFSLTKRIPCWDAANTAEARPSISAWKTGSRWFTGRFPKRSAHWAASLPAQRRRCNTCVSTRIRMSILKALELAISHPELRAKLWENANYFYAQLHKLGLDTGASTTYVMPIVIGDRGRMYRLGHQLRRRGLWVAPVDYPAVPQNRICFRACVTAKHTRADLDEALNILEETLVPALLQKQSA